MVMIVICLIVKGGFFVCLSLKNVISLVMEIRIIKNRVIDCLWMVSVERLKCLVFMVGFWWYYVCVVLLDVLFCSGVEDGCSG